MAEFQELLDFPSGPQAGWDGKLDPAKATPAEMHGQEVFLRKRSMFFVSRAALLHATTPCITCRPSGSTSSTPSMEW